MKRIKRLVILVNHMEKMNFNKITSIVLGVVISANLLLSPIVSFAQSTRDDIKAKRASLFCDRISNLSGIDQKIAEREATIEQKRADRINRLKEKRNRGNERRVAARAKWDVNRAERYKKLLEASAMTDEKKQAIIVFKTTLEEATKMRRATIDSATQTFRAGVDQEIRAEGTAIKAMINTFKSDIRSATEKAKNDCASSADSATVNQVLRSSIKVAMKQFTTDIKSLGLKDAIKPFTEARKEASKQAIETFKSTMQKAREDLKAALEA